MIHFGQIDAQTFLREYWQKKPLLIRQALPDFICPLSPEELAGLALEDDFEARLITGTGQNKNWTLKTNPLIESDFTSLPEKDWTLLVQGVDRWIDPVADLVASFDFIPRWRFDDVMISYAPIGGSVGAHFDFYDVFLLQGAGKRRWQISDKHCHLDNYLADTPLRIMADFEPQQSWDLVAGDVLYLPPKIAHHGVSLTNDCMTLSFGYRAYAQAEFLEYLDSPVKKTNDYYQDPSRLLTNTPAEFNAQDIKQTEQLTKQTMSIEQFGCFITRLDVGDKKILHDISLEQLNTQQTLEDNHCYYLHPSCKIAYYDGLVLTVFVNGKLLVGDFKKDDLINFCNTRQINTSNSISQHFFDNHWLV